MLVFKKWEQRSENCFAFSGENSSQEKTFDFDFATIIGGINTICGTDSCSCARCDWPYRYILGFNDDENIFYKCPCSTYSCECDSSATFLEEVISDWRDIDVP